jgi:hypothetical protein
MPRDTAALMAVEPAGASDEGAGAAAAGGRSDEDAVAPDSDGGSDVKMGVVEAVVDQKQLGIALQASALVACWHASAALRWLFAV